MPANTTEGREVGPARCVEASWIHGGPSGLVPCEVVVSGPDRDDEICLLAGGETYLPRETAHALAMDLLSRLIQTGKDGG